MNNKWLSPIALLSGFLISGVAAYFSILGLSKLFASAAFAVIIFGISIEIGKLVSASWLFHNWRIAPKLLKTYMFCAVGVLMLITSLGIWGYLNKSYADQTAPMTVTNIELVAKRKELEIEQSRVTAARKNLAQIDSIVDKRIASDKDDLGARQRLNRDRTAEQKEIKDANSRIITLQKEIAQLETSNQAIAHEVGPINYIAKLVYSNDDPNAVDKAVQIVIILLVLVFDPLAIALLLAANFSMGKKSILIKPNETGPIAVTSDELIEYKKQQDQSVEVSEIKESILESDENGHIEESAFKPLNSEKGIGEVIHHDDGTISYKG
jgi:predicted alpha/beta hydrolase family esterase